MRVVSLQLLSAYWIQLRAFGILTEEGGIPTALPPAVSCEAITTLQVIIT